MKKMLLLALAFFFAALAYSQSPSKESEEGKWELGFDLYAAFSGKKKLNEFSIKELLQSTQVASDLPIFRHVFIVKRQLSPKQKLRARIGFVSEEARNRPNYLPETDLISGGPLGGYLSFGLERYLRIGRVSAFFGGEAFGYFLRYVDRVDSQNVGGPGYTSRTVRDTYTDQQYGLRPLFGINVRLLPHLHLSAESSVRLAYRRQYNYYIEYWDQTLYVSGGRTIKRFTSSVEPISAIHLIYHF